MTPSLAGQLAARGHDVIIQRGAGLKSGLADAEYEAAGATLVETAGQVWGNAELIVKVKEPVVSEYPMFRPEHVIFSFLHLAAAPDCERALVGAGCTAIAFETVELDDGSLPMLAPMSQVAGRLAVQFGAHHLTAPQGGRGVLLGGIAGTEPGRVVIIGAGSAGLAAADAANGLRADVTLIDRGATKFGLISERWDGRVAAATSSDRATVGALIAAADLVVCAALVPGARAPVLVTEAMVGAMRDGAVIVDVSIDQGGNCAASRPTTHGKPTFRAGPALVCGITNLPAAVPRTSTFALASAIAPYVTVIADQGWQRAAELDSAIARGVNVTAGQVTHPALLAGGN